VWRLCKHSRSSQRTTAATEAVYLLARHAFDELGYRRLEWKCTALNDASRREEWPGVRAGFGAWLSRNNSDLQGRQRRPLAELRRSG
jgi:hypothetical protein